MKKYVRTPLHVCHQNMMTRCYKTNHKSYHNYGGRGIKVCDRWHNFLLFAEDMPGWKPGLTLERVDVNGHYEPNNCKWATRTEQGNNKRDNVILEVLGEKKTMKEWSRIYDMAITTFFNRLKRGMSPYDALTTPIKCCGKRSRSTRKIQTSGVAALKEVGSGSTEA